MKPFFALLLTSVVAVSLIRGEDEPDDSFQKHELAQAGSVAVSNGNIPLMKALVQAGLPIDEPLYANNKGSPGWTALHLCCVQNQPAMMKWLLRHGAQRKIRDKNNQRPIDMAVEKGNKALCELLALPDEKEASINDIPRGLFEELLRPRLSQRDLPLFIRINGKDPDSTAMFLLGVSGKSRVPASLAEEYAEGGKVGYRLKGAKTVGELVEIEISKTQDDPFGNDYKWSIRGRTGPALAGGGSRGKIAKLHGYWVVTQTESWDE